MFQEGAACSWLCRDRDVKRHHAWACLGWDPTGCKLHHGIIIQELESLQNDFSFGLCSKKLNFIQGIAAPFLTFVSYSEIQVHGYLQGMVEKDKMAAHQVEIEAPPLFEPPS